MEGYARTDSGGAIFRSLGLVVVLFAWLKSADSASDRSPVAPQAAWRWHG